jgi:hypothetical protein
VPTKLRQRFVGSSPKPEAKDERENQQGNGAAYRFYPMDKLMIIVESKMPDECET